MSSCRPAPADAGPALLRLRRAHVLAQLGDGAFYVTSAAYLVRLGWSPTRVGLLLGVCWGVGALLSRRIGRVADRRGLVGISAATVGGCAVGLFGLAVLSAPPLVAGAFLVYAVGQSAWGGLRAALVQLAADPTSAVAERARLQSVGNGAVAVGAAMGGLSLSIGAVAALRTVVAVDALLYVSTALLVARGLRAVAPPPWTPPATPGCPDRATLRQLVATAAASALYLYMPLLSVALPLMVTASAGVPTWTISACFVANTIGVMALQRRVAARVTSERRARHALLTGGVLLAASAVLLWTSLHGQHTPVLLAAGLGLGLLTQVLGEVRFAAGAWDLGYRLARPGGTAAWQATYGAAIPVARSIGPAVLAPLATVPAGWIVPALLFLAGATAMVAVTTTRPAPADAARSAA